MKTIIEQFRIQSAEPLHQRDILIDLLPDSGTSAMSKEQWACSA